MIQLIAFRAVQGIGGGGLIIGAQTIVGDVVSPRERGRYQGLFGSGVRSDQRARPAHRRVLRGQPVLALGVLRQPADRRRGAAGDRGGAAVGGDLRRVAHKIDYLGTLLLAAAATSLVLLTSLGGTTYGWASPPIIIMGAGGVVLRCLFVLTERRAAEPVLPLRLFRYRVFSVSSAVGFVVGFSMFGAIAYLPQYMQIVKGVSPTISGLRLLPLVLGLLATSTGSGWRSASGAGTRMFPIVGTAS